MNEVFEKILERLDSHIEDAKSEGDFSYIKPFEIAKRAVQEVAEEYNGGWIACSERLPKIFEDTKSSEVVLICGYDKQNDYYWQAMGFYVKAESIKRWFFADCKKYSLRNAYNLVQAQICLFLYYNWDISYTYPFRTVLKY